MDYDRVDFDSIYYILYYYIIFEYIFFFSPVKLDAGLPDHLLDHVPAQGQTETACLEKRGLVGRQDEHLANAVF